MKAEINTRVHHYAEMMLEHTSVGMAVYDATDFCLLEANTLFLTFLRTQLAPEWQDKEIIGRRVCEWEKYTQEPGITDIFRSVATTGIRYHKDEYVFSSKRQTTYWNWTLTPVYDSQGRITHLVQTICEVTKQVLARQQAENARSALNHTHNTVEAERKRLEVVETVARSVRETLNIDRLGRLIIDTIITGFDASSSCLHIADREQRVFRLLYARIPPWIEEGQMKSMQYVPFERMATTRLASQQREPIVVEDMQAAAAAGKLNKNNPVVLTGSLGYVCVPLWFGDQLEGTISATFMRPIYQHSPEIQALVASCTHIAAALAHARLHTKVEREHMHLRSILDQLPEGILIVEVTNGTVSYANPAAAHILGITLNELTAKPLNQHSWANSPGVTLDGHPMLPWNFAIIRALSGETIKGKETVVIKPCGSRVVTLTSSAPLFSDNGIMTGAMIVFQDVTAQKSLEQHKNDFLSIANHELRTPITVIQGFAEILQLKISQDLPMDSLTQYALTSITEQSQHLTHLIEEMLDISRIEQSQFTLNRGPHDLLSLITHVIDSQAITTRLHTLNLVRCGLQHEDTLICYIDEKRIVQVLNNLINNAIKYSPMGGDIEIGICHSAERPYEVHIWVQDQGIGIAADEIPHIFKRFHRASNIDRSLSGFGIGLYLVKEVVTRHGGRVWVESTEGQGSTFHITLPLNTSGIF